MCSRAYSGYGCGFKESSRLDSIQSREISLSLEHLAQRLAMGVAERGTFRSGPELGVVECHHGRKHRPRSRAQAAMIEAFEPVHPVAARC
jgi:hypothetical protein